MSEDAPDDAGRRKSILAFPLDAKPILVVSGLVLALLGLRAAPFDSLREIPGLRALSGSDAISVEAFPDTGENQQLIFTEWPGRSPEDVDDQVTFPLSAALQGVPGIARIRSSSAFGFSTIYLIFEEEIPFYESRTRILEKLAALPAGLLPNDAIPTLGPDATALGQVLWYTLEVHDEHGEVASGAFDLHELRRIQDWNVRYALQGVPGVSEVSSIGGYVEELQVQVDPDSMRAYGVSLGQIARAIRRSSEDVGAHALEINRVEYILRSRGLVRSIEDLEEAVVVERDNTPIRIKDVAEVSWVPAPRRGGLDDEGAETVGGVVVARYGQNPAELIERVREKIETLRLPMRELEDGRRVHVEVVPFYDRSTLIAETVETLSSSLWQQMLIALLVVFFLLRAPRSSLLLAFTLPFGVLLALLTMQLLGMSANLMALGGIAIAIGTMVDLGIVIIESVRAKQQRLGRELERSDVLDAASEVAPAILTSTLTTIISFLPVFALPPQDAKLFGPLAATKTFAMVAALFIALLFLPAAVHSVQKTARHSSRFGLEKKHILWFAIAIAAFLVHALIGTILVLFLLFDIASEHAESARSKALGALLYAIPAFAIALALSYAIAIEWRPLGGASSSLANVLFVGAILFLTLGFFALFERSYPRLLGYALRNKGLFSLLPFGLVLTALFAWVGAANIFEYSPDSVRDSAFATNAARVFPGLGREYMPRFDEGAFLYMPTTMPHASVGEIRQLTSELDARISEVPEVARVVGKWGRAESALDPAPASMIETLVTLIPEFEINEDGERVRRWRDEIRAQSDIWEEIVQRAEVPGLTGAPLLMPIEARRVMLQSGMRASLGLRVQANTFEEAEAFAMGIQRTLEDHPALRPGTIFADRSAAKPYLQFELDRRAIARLGLHVSDVQDVIRTGVGGAQVGELFADRIRFPIRLRYAREERDHLAALESLAVPTPSGESVPLGQVASLVYARGPQAIKSENTFRTTYVVFDRRAELSDLDAIAEVRTSLDEAIESGALPVPDGATFEFAGSYEQQLRSEARLRWLIPIALALIFILLFLQFRKVRIAFMVFSSVSVAIAGAFVILWAYQSDSFLAFSFGEFDLREIFRVRPTHLSMAVWVGIIALIGIATDDGVLLSTYLEHRFRETTPPDRAAIHEAVIDAGSRRIRPCLMTSATTLLALLPVIASSGRGADVMAPMAIPMVGGMLAALIALFVVPVLYAWDRERGLSASPIPTLSPPNRTPKEEE